MTDRGPVDSSCRPDPLFALRSLNCNIAEEYPNITPYAALDPGDKPAYVSGLLSHQIVAPKEDTWTGPDDLGFARIPARLCLALGLGDSSPGGHCDPVPPTSGHVILRTNMQVLTTALVSFSMNLWSFSVVTKMKGIHTMPLKIEHASQ